MARSRTTLATIEAAAIESEVPSPPIMHSDGQGKSGGVRLLADNNPKIYTDFDLYMMGLLAADQVGEHIVFNDQTDPTIQQCNGQLYTGPVTRVHASDVVAAFGSCYLISSKTLPCAC